MRKILTVFYRDYSPGSSGRFVLPEVNPECAWVLASEGVATRMWDGTCVLVEADGSVWSRREVKPRRPEPPGFRLVQTTPTGKLVGWERAGQSGWFRFIIEAMTGKNTEPGLYELVGPKVNNNPERFHSHVLIPLGRHHLDDVPRDHDGLRDYLQTHPDMEGIVFWRDPGNPDGDMAKVKRKDFRE